MVSYRFDTPYPRVKETITVDDCIRSFRFSDIMQWTGATVGSWLYGFAVGKPARFALAGMMMGVGFTFGSLVAVQNARNRLCGYVENEREQKMWGTVPNTNPNPGKLPDLKFNERY